MRKKLFSPVVSCTLFAACAVTPAAEETESPGTPREPEMVEEKGGKHEIALFLGGGVEQLPGEHEESGYAVALEFARRLRGPWALSFTFEHLGGDVDRENLVVVPVSYFATEHWRILAGPGIGFLDEGPHFVFRAGTSYGFDIGNGWRFGPELFVDFVEGGGNVYVAGLALGYEF